MFDVSIRFRNGTISTYSVTDVEYKILTTLAIQSRPLQALKKKCGEAFAEMAVTNLIERGLVTTKKTEVDPLGVGTKRVRFDTECKAITILQKARTTKQSKRVVREPQLMSIQELFTL